MSCLSSSSRLPLRGLSTVSTKAEKPAFSALFTSPLVNSLSKGEVFIVVFKLASDAKTIVLSAKKTDDSVQIKAQDQVFHVLWTRDIGTFTYAIHNAPIIHQQKQSNEINEQNQKNNTNEGFTEVFVVFSNSSIDK